MYILDHAGDDPIRDKIVPFSKPSSRLGNSNLQCHLNKIVGCVTVDHRLYKLHDPIFAQLRDGIHTAVPLIHMPPLLVLSAYLYYNGK